MFFTHSFMGGIKKTIAFVYVVVGLYLLNASFAFIKLPEFILVGDKVFILIAGAIVIFSGIRLFMKSNDYS